MTDLADDRASGSLALEDGDGAHTECVQAQPQRDEKSITIFIGLLLAAVGLPLLWMLDRAFNLSGGLSGSIVCGAVLVAFIYISRHQRP